MQLPPRTDSAQTGHQRRDRHAVDRVVHDRPSPWERAELGEVLVEGSLAPGQQLPIPLDLRDLIAKRLRRLPRRTQEALLRVRALAQPTISLVDPADLAPAEEAGVARVRSDGRIELAHPLFAGALYAGASYERRRKLHGELAEIASDVEERARHLVLMRASDDTDAHLAAVLHDAAEHALRRGAVEAAADLDEQAARRTPSEQMDVRWQRNLRAAWHHLKAGDRGRSRSLCEEVLGATPPSSVRAHALRQLAETFATERPESAIPLLEEALACVGDDAGHAAQLEIAPGLMIGVGFDWVRSHRHLIRAVELAERAGDSTLIAGAIALKECAGLLSGEGLDEKALERALALEDLEREVPFQMRASSTVAQAYEFTGRVDLARGLFFSLRERLVARGEEGDLPWVLGHLATTAWSAISKSPSGRRATPSARLFSWAWTVSAPTR